jgi:hypothetical protein
VHNVDDLARRYSYVLLSRRLLRAMAAAAFVGALMLLVVLLITPTFPLFDDSGRRGSWLRLALLALLVAAGIAAAVALSFVCIRVLSVFAVGATRPITMLLLVALPTTLVIGLRDLDLATGSSPLSFVAVGSLFLHILTGVGLVVGPMELRRATALERAVLAEPRAGTGILAEIARLMHLPDARAFTRERRVRAWTLVGFSLLLEGSAFYTLLRWPDRLNKAAASPWPADLANVSPIVIAGATVAIVSGTLWLSLLMIRWLLRLARRLRVKARRLTLQSADTAIAADPRSPVLFLRSFEEDQVPLKGATVPWFLRAFDPGSEYGTLEEMIVLNLTYIGPVVAVADPSRAEAPVGAARWRVDDDEWQRFVEEQIRAANLIVVGLARSAGLRWEIDAVRRIPGALDKAVFVCPPESSQSPSMLSVLADAVGYDHDVLAAHVRGRPVLMATGSSAAAPDVFVASAVTELAYYVALRSCILRQGAASGVGTAALPAAAGFPGTAKSA